MDAIDLPSKKIIPLSMPTHTVQEYLSPLLSDGKCISKKASQVILKHMGYVFPICDQEPP